MLIDTHAHLADHRILPEVDAVVARAVRAGVARIVSVATGPDDWEAGLDLVGRFPGVVATTVGIHPHQAGAATPAALDRVRALLDDPRVVAVGETGLDHHYDFAPRDAQRAAFVRHLEMAAETGKPVVVHAREADVELRAVLREHGGGTVGVLHSFASGGDLLEEALALGWYASFSGMVTFRSFAAEALLRLVPADRIMVETDTPYLAPAPHRGRTNEPAYVVEVARRCADLRGEPFDAFAARTADNARRFYGLG